jgi:RsiW-degrading membrane proteinase PrsW (M82 family)
MAANIRLQSIERMEVASEAWKEWLGRHPRVVSVSTAIYRPFAWISLIVLILGLIFLEDSRRVFVQFLWSFYVLLQFWVLCRSKTLTWRRYSAFFLAGAWVCAPLAALVVLPVHAVFGGEPTDAWSQAALTPVVEEGIKLMPLGVYLFLSRRASSLSLCDYALVGAASGAGFQYVEETTRRLIQSGGNWHLGESWDLFTLFPGASLPSIFHSKMFAGHAVITAMVALSIGLAVRYRDRLGRYAYLFPGSILAWAIFDHGMYNSQYTAGAAPGLLSAIHRLLGSGFAAKPVFLILLGIALVADYRALNRVRNQLPALANEPPISLVSELRNLATSFLTDRRRFGYLLLFYRERRDLGFTLLSGWEDARPRLPALLENVRSYHRFLAAGAAILLLGVVSAGWLTAADPDSACFACMFEHLHDWWNELPLYQKAMVGLALFGVALLAMEFMPALSIALTGVGIAESSKEIADTIRNPRRLLSPDVAIALGIEAFLNKIPGGGALKRRIEEWLTRRGWRRSDGSEDAADIPVRSANYLENIENILMPGGAPLGTPGSQPRIRELPGGMKAAQDMFLKLAHGGTDITPPSYPGMMVLLPGGEIVGFRQMSGSGQPTIDVNIPSIPDVMKIKFK